MNPSKTHIMREYKHLAQKPNMRQRIASENESNLIGNIFAQGESGYNGAITLPKRKGIGHAVVIGLVFSFIIPMMVEF
ncbi:hypothetical protein [Methylobacillus sp.]|mgnify:CR=1 FL=1|uniref:hypothetical protein n=1 Tax=Methylobacillus sp. TaxID=56818 RepID=UPI002FE2BE18